MRIRTLVLAAVAGLFLTGCSTKHPPKSFSFNLGGVEGDNVSFKGIAGKPWIEVSYGCSACTFYVSEAGIQGDPLSEKTPGVSVHRGGDPKVLTFRCQAELCVAAENMAGQTRTHRLRRGGRLDVLTTSAVSFTVQG